MLICPELQKVFILNPRTGTGSLYRELTRVYPRSFLLYRHMEADGVPQGYDRWERLGVVRHPTVRLWSFYNFLRKFNYSIENNKGVHREEAHLDRVRKSADHPFEDWLLNNNEVFSLGHDLQKGDYHYPVLSRRHPLPDNKMSQFIYLRPDLGVRVVKFQDVPAMYDELGLNKEFVQNASGKAEMPSLTEKGIDHIQHFFKWDLEQSCNFS